MLVKPVGPILCGIAVAFVFATAPATATAAGRYGFHARLGVGVGAGQDWVPTGIDPLLGISAHGAAGFGLTGDFAVELLADGLFATDFIEPRFEGSLLQVGIHGAISMILPYTDDAGFVVGGIGPAVVNNNEVTRYGGSVIAGIGFNIPDKVKLPFGAAAFYAPRVVVGPAGFVHALHVDVFMRFAL